MLLPLLLALVGHCRRNGGPSRDSIDLGMCTKCHDDNVRKDLCFFTDSSLMSDFLHTKLSFV